MNRFKASASTGRTIPKFILPLLLFGCILGMLLFVSDSVSRTASADRLSGLQRAIRRSAVHCYATEGNYPQSLDYLCEHYGLSWDHTRYVVDYEVSGSNLMPVINVFELSSKEGLR